jgi:AcrR family transcriptional regulator
MTRRCPFDGVTVDEIADAAGVAHGLLFHYFGSKHGLYLEMMRNAAEQLEKIHLDPHPPIFHQRKSSLLSCADMWTLSGGARFPTSFIREVLCHPTSVKSGSSRNSARYASFCDTSRFLSLRADSWHWRAPGSLFSTS